MTDLTSKIFPEATFTGTYKKECPDDVTYMDQGKLPLSTPSIDLEYTFEFCRLIASTFYHHSTNEIKASSRWESPEKCFFDSRMDELYSRIMSDLEQAKQKLIRDDPHIIDRYPHIANTGIFDRSMFNRMAVMNVDYEENPFLGLEQKLDESFGVSEVESPVENFRKINLKNRVSLEIGDNFIPKGITILAPFKVTRKIYEQVRDFLSEQLKSKNPRIDTTNHHVYLCAWRFQHEQGHYLIEEVFKKDIEQLPKQEIF